MSAGCKRSIDEMQPSYQPGDTSISTANGTLNKSHVPCLSETHSSLLSDINAPFLSISPVLALSDSYEDLRGDSACSRLETLDSVSSPLEYGLNEELYLDQCSPITGWNRCLDLGLDADHLEDVFTASKETLGVGPTLAALNSGEKSVLDDLELDDLSLPEEISSHIRGSGLPTPSHDSQDSLSIPLVCNVAATANVEIPSAQSHALVKQEPQSEIPKHSTLHDLLVQNRSPRSTTLTVTSQNPPGNCLEVKAEPIPPSESYYEHHQLHPKQLSNDCPMGLTPLNSEPYMNQVGLNSNSVVLDPPESIKTEVTDNESHDEGFDSELDESDHYNEDCSDAESLSSLDLSHTSNSPVTVSKTRKKERYFWQYNLQAKGPKGNRMPLSSDQLDPHMLDEITDPVFSPTCQVKGIKHTGKARRGDGNDLTPNPTKLFHIGQELKELNKVINDLTPVSDLPFNARSKSRKEKNKLASRACRLKKKAQHEANKLKLYGLEQEHRRLMYVINEMKKSFRNPKAECVAKRGGLYQQYEDLSSNYLKTKVAGHTVEFVNAILERVSSGTFPDLFDQI